MRSLVPAFFPRRCRNVNFCQPSQAVAGAVVYSIWNQIMRHHEIFDKFECWEGYVDPGFGVNFLGVLTRSSFASWRIRDMGGQLVATELPAFDEEYFEWIDILEAVITARDQFTIIELGAGWGRWLANAMAALRQVNNLPYTLIGVEPEPTHFKWMREHLQTNGVNLARCQLVRAAASRNEGTVWFATGRPAEWYGQAIACPPPTIRMLERFRYLFEKSTVRVKKVKGISLNTLLRSLEHVDLIDLDVQGAELDVLENSAEQLDVKVKRVHIGTHSSEIESGLRKLFHSLGWQKVNDYPCGCENDTPWGVITFQDGVQTWINPRL